MSEPPDEARDLDIAVCHTGDVGAARRRCRELAAELGFAAREIDELALVINELGANLIRHAGGGRLVLRPLREAQRQGLQIEARDQGPGIGDLDQALTDGFSTAGGLGYGLGTVNRLMDTLELRPHSAHGTHMICRRWTGARLCAPSPCPLTFGAATRPRRQLQLNGDTFIIKQWECGALVGVIDGLGHGEYAHRAAQAARGYIEKHHRRPLAEIFLGTGRACRGTRGVVMSLAVFDWLQRRMRYAGIGNIEARLFHQTSATHLIGRRGIIGLNAPKPVVSEHDWGEGHLLIMHSDGLKTHWQWKDFASLSEAPAPVIAHHLLRALAKDEDDATVVAVR